MHSYCLMRANDQFVAGIAGSLKAFATEDCVDGNTT